MPNSTQYFRNLAAEISYCSAGYVRTDWRSLAAEPAELRAIYGHVLRAMQRYDVTAALFVHQQPAAVPAELQHWLASEWLPRAVREANYQRCALVELAQPGSPADTDVPSSPHGRPECARFSEVAEARAWLLRPSEAV
ncbi:MAG: hypothetical protein ACRYG7_28920 [Janthinobacterium lividum]